MLEFLWHRRWASGNVLKTIVIVRCGQVRAAFDRAAVQEITPLPDLTHPPSAPRPLEGLMNLAGAVVPVVGLAGVIGEAATDASEEDRFYQHVVVLRGAGAGLLVDRVEDVQPVDEAAIVPVSARSSFNGCVTGYVELDGGKIHMLDAERIFLTAERKWLADLQRAEQERLDRLLSA